MGPAPFQVSARKPEPNAAIAKAAGKGSPVKQDIAVTVTADKIECAVNGTVVGSYNKADVVAAGKLKSTDGVYGIRFAHNTEATVSELQDDQEVAPIDTVGAWDLRLGRVPRPAPLTIPKVPPRAD